jgi:hypothetical protein
MKAEFTERKQFSYWEKYFNRVVSYLIGAVYVGLEIILLLELVYEA